MCLHPQHQKSHTAHVLAVVQAKKSIRSVLIVGDDGRHHVLPFCLRSSSCQHCEGMLEYYSHTNLGTLHPLTRVLPLEVNAVPTEHGSAT